MKKFKIIPVILCGGSGTRLWPLSRAGFPKQFLSLLGSDGVTLFQQAVERINAIDENQINQFSLGPTVVVTNEEHRFLALEQLREVGRLDSILILESAGRNTAPALTTAALYAQSELNLEEGVEVILVVTPADQTIQRVDAFTDSLMRSIEVAKDGSIVILGITPNAPETGYGYIKCSGSRGEYGEFGVEEFVEKPNIQTAQNYINSGNYFWNGGMFVLKADAWLDAIKFFRPDIEIASSKAWNARAVDSAGNSAFIRPDVNLFKEIPSQSIDYAVIEKCPGSRIPIKMIGLDADWSDLGSWEAVWQVANKSSDGNVVSGDVLLSKVSNSFIRADTRLVGAVGIENLIVIETADAVLVANRTHSQDVKDLVAQLESQQRPEKNLHRKVNRPWGWYDSVDVGERFKVKRIRVDPGASLSLQMHHHRAEHWIVVKGVALITNGDQVMTLKENQSTYIPQGQVHRLSNPGDSPLEIIEVQSGSYLGEDDIVRYEDTYGRS